ncbi:MAG: hypothetical protein AAGH48_06395 [Pseudomonadota bacterium]
MTAAFVAMAAVFSVRVFVLNAWRENLFETLFQGGLIAAMCFTLLIWRSVMFPYAAPGHAFASKYVYWDSERFNLPP